MSEKQVKETSMKNKIIILSVMVVFIIAAVFLLLRNAAPSKHLAAAREQQQKELTQRQKDIDFMQSSAATLEEMKQTFARVHRTEKDWEEFTINTCLDLNNNPYLYIDILKKETLFFPVNINYRSVMKSLFAALPKDNPVHYTMAIKEREIARGLIQGKQIIKDTAFVIYDEKRDDIRPLAEDPCFAYPQETKARILRLKYEETAPAAE